MGSITIKKTTVVRDNITIKPMAFRDNITQMAWDSSASFTTFRDTPPKFSMEPEKKSLAPLGNHHCQVPMLNFGGVICFTCFSSIKEANLR